MKKVKAYRCDFCGKVYLKRGACDTHEEHLCPRNPKNRPMCYDCKYYQPSMEDGEQETISCRVESTWTSHDIVIAKKFDPNRCGKKGCKLFNNIKLSDEMQDALCESDYNPMPLSKENCEDFESKEDGENFKTDKLIFRTGI